MPACCKRQSRSVAGQVSHWVRSGRAIEQSGACDLARVTAMLEGVTMVGMRLVLTVVIVTLATVGHAREVDLSASMTDPDVGFAINYPPSWSVQTHPEVNAIDFGDDFAFFTVEAVERSILPSSDADDIIDSFVSALDQEIADLELRTGLQRVIADQPAVGVSYSGTDFEYPLEGALYVLLTDAFAFVFSVEAYAEKFDDYAPVFDAMLASFRVNLD